MKEELFLNALVGSLMVVVAGVFVSIPVGAWHSAGITQKALNRECGTTYTQWDTLWASENLTELCRIKQQEILFKR